MVISSYTSAYTVNSLGFSPQAVSVYSDNGVGMHYYKSVTACRESTGAGGDNYQFANSDAMTITDNGFTFYPAKTHGDNWWGNVSATFVAYKNVSPFG